MRRLVLFVAVVFLVCAVADHAEAQCVKCRFDGACATCGTTSFDAYILCTIVNNGYGCSLQGSCEVASGEQCFIGCVQEKEARLQPRDLRLRGEWQLVSVEVSHATAPVRKKRQS